MIGERVEPGKPVYFGTDGIRGRFGEGLLQEDFVTRFGSGVASFVHKLNGVGRPRIAMGRDTRFSGPALAEWLSRGLVGCEVVDLGILPTPAVACLTRLCGFDFGIALTASHNPVEDNGIKLFHRPGLKLTEEEEMALEGMIPSRRIETPEPRRAPPVSDPLTAYLEQVMEAFPSLDLRGLKLVCDTAHGATVRTTPVVLKHFGATVISIGDHPDGRNINQGVGSEHPESLAEKVREVGADAGLAHDGDGDRIVVVDRHGAVLAGEKFLGVLALEVFQERVHQAKPFVTTWQSNSGLDASLADRGIETLRTGIGDRFVSHRMIESGSPLGGENSGHIILSRHLPTGDGLVAALELLRITLGRQRDLSEAAAAICLLPQFVATCAVSEKRPLDSCQALKRALEAFRNETGTRGRTLVRYSGTESKLRILVEHPESGLGKQWLQKIEAAAQEDLAGSVS